MRFFYSALFYALLPIIALRMLWRSRRAPAYRRRMAERLGFFTPPADGKPVLLVHAVSVGETLAAAPVIEAMLARYPDHTIAVTTTTPTGSEQVQRLFGERVFHVYLPWDLPGAVARFFVALNPRLLVVMETELWPNLIHSARARGCKVLIANARLSERSARGYGRFSGLTEGMLSRLDCVACQNTQDGQRFLALGLPSPALHITGSIKFDVDLDESLRAQAAALPAALGLGQRPVIVAASTHDPEEAMILKAFALVKQQHPSALLLLVPRHPERFKSVAQLCESEGMQTVLRSSGEPVTDATDVLLGDTMGELKLLISCATVALIGGSLIPHGGHNMLEASAWGVPVVTGPHVFNFAEISQLLVDAGAMTQLADPDQLAETLQSLLADEAQRAAMSAAALKVVEENRGARQRLLALIDTLVPVQ